jgi:hypothetical protein
MELLSLAAAVSEALQHQRDVWAEFASEPASDDITTSSSRREFTKATGSSDGLSLFPSESGADVSSEPRSRTAPVMTTIATGNVPARDFVTRWVVPFAVAFVFGSSSVLVTLHMLDGRSADQQASDSPSLAAVDLQPSLLASLDRIEMTALLPRAAVGSRSTSPHGVTRATLDYDAATVAPAVLGTERPRAIETIPIAAPQKIATPSLSSQPLTTLPGVEITDDEQAVGRVIRSYEEAYERVDAAAIARLWPAVDRTALTQAFEGVTSQGLGLKNCAIVLTGGQATAQCRGTLKSVAKGGTAVMITSEQEWVFKMRRDSGEWKIEEVSPSQTPSLVAGAGRGQH